MKSSRVVVFLVLLTAAVLATARYRQNAPSAAPDPIGVPRAGVDRRGAPPEVSLDLAALPARGSAGAKIVLVEFSDYECPYCARHAQEVGPELDRRYVETGLVRYAFANNPLSFHPNAKLLAAAAICAGSQDRFWPMHNRLFAEKARTRVQVMSIAASLQLDGVRFEQCLENSPDPLKRIQADMESAQQLQMTGTPGFAIGTVDPEGRVTVRKIIMGAQPFEVFRNALDQLLSESKAGRT